MQQLRKWLFLGMALLAAPATWACEVCQQNQPKALQGITHGPGPQGNWDYAIILVGVIIVAFTLYYSLKFLIRPGETHPDHIKNIVVDGNY